MEPRRRKAQEQGHDLILFAGGSWELLGCLRCGATAQVNKNHQLLTKCKGVFSSRTKQKQWEDLVSTGRYPYSNERVGEGVPLQRAAAQAWMEMQGSFLEDSELEDAAAEPRL